MATINLAPASGYLVAARARRQRLFAVAGVIAIGLLLVWGVLWLVQRRLVRIQTVRRNELTEVKAQFQQLESDSRRIILFENRLAAVDHLLNTHINWEPVLSDLEKFLVPGVVLTEAELQSTSGSVTLKGYASDVDQVAQTVASLTSREGRPTVFTEASLENIEEELVKVAGGQPTPRYRFALSLHFEPAKLR